MVAEAATEATAGSASTGNVFEGRQQGGRISPGTARHRPDDPGVAALLLGFAQGAAEPPDGRVPPVQPGDDQLDPADPMVAPFQMSQLVEHQRRPLLLVQGRPELPRHQQPGTESDRPEHRRDFPRHHADDRGTSQG